jgi:predicted kinase
MKQKIVVMQGIQGSGKSTHAKEIVNKDSNFVRVCRDDLREMRGKYWIPEQEKMISEWEDFLVKSALNNGKSVVIDAMNMYDKTIQKWKKIAKEYNAEIEFKFINTSLLECIERDKNRERTTGAKIIKETYLKYEHFYFTEKMKQDPDVPLAIIVDIDGTLAERNGRGPFEWNRVGEDLVKEEIATLVRIYKSHYFEVIVFSGRDSICRPETEKWLEEKEIYYDYLYMRKEGDNRKDFIIKKELFDEFVKDKFYVSVVIDDRKQVVDMWRDMGLTCLQVDKGEF